MPVSFLTPSPSYRGWRPWYQRPQFYIPAIVVAVVAVASFVYFSSLAAGLKEEAASFDLHKMEQMESASVILDRNGKIFGQIYVENRETVPYDQLPRDLINAVVAVEDSKFYQHSGYDLSGIVRATLKNLASGHVRQGASTITQQLARNSFALKERTFRRKLLEVFLAQRIEEAFGKQKIMELYLNRIYFGGGLYGAEAASRGYFGKSARDITLAEAATLTGLIKSPNRLSPWSDKNGSRDARNVALNRMRENGFITADRASAAKAEEVVVGNRQSAQGQTYAVDYIRQKVIDAVGWDRAMNEGFRIKTTLDVELQTAAEKSLRASLDRTEEHVGYEHQTYAQYAATFKKGKVGPTPEYLQGAVIAIDNADGGVLVLVGGRDFEHNQYDRALQARRPAGTAMTPFVYAAAFEKGMYGGSIVEDSALDNRAVMIGGTTGILGEWGPESAENRYEGPITAREALAKSKNGAAIRVGMNAGVDAVLQLCKNAGMKSPLRPYPATFLGSSEVTLGELALAYTTFPNGGWRPNEFHILERIEDKEGKVVWETEHDTTRRTVVKPQTAFEVHSCLVDALEIGTGRAALDKFGLNKISAAGKTGTAYDFTDAIFAGYTNRMTCAVWAGFDKPQKIFRGAFSSDIALPVWVDVMNAATAHYPAKEISPPSGLQKVKVCAKSGLLANDQCIEAKTAYDEWATAAQKPGESCNIHGERRGRIAKELPLGDWPRAALAVDTTHVTAISVLGPTLLADKDPYNSPKATIQPKVTATPTPIPVAVAGGTSPISADEEMPDPTKPIMKAEAVQPTPDETGFRTRPAQTTAPVERPVRRARPLGPVTSADQTPVEVRRAVPIRATPTPVPVRRAQTPPPEEDEERPN